jgi:preprotein translocase subunit SecF
MEVFKKTTRIDFLGKRRYAYVFSAVLILISLGSLLTRGLNLGIDFTGGTLVEVGFSDVVELADVRSALAEAGFADATVQHFGTSKDVLVRLAPKEEVASAVISDQAYQAMQQVDSSAELRRVEFVGPQVGDELTEDGGLAMLYSIIGILIYVGLRFEYRLALGAVIALVHDVIVTIGVFTLFQIPFDLPVLAAVLAVIGYSLNDTIVVYDRIRENFRKVRKGTTLEISNISLNQTLSRTIFTSVTTLLVLFALFIFGGEIIHGFALALIVGVVIGTYSTIYVASSAALLLGLSRTDLLPVEKEGAGEPGEVVDNRP